MSLATRKAHYLLGTLGQVSRRLSTAELQEAACHDAYLPQKLSTKA